MSQERIDMLKEMIEQSANPAGWIGYYEGKPATFLFKQEDVPIFLKNTEPVGSVVPLYTHPAKTLTDEEISDVINNEFGHKFNGYEICFLYAFAKAILKKASDK